MNKVKVFYALLTIIALLGAAMVIKTTARTGIWVSVDSICYQSAADNLVKGRGLVQYDLTPLVHWPPGLPALTAAAMVVTGHDSLSVMRWINVLSFSLTVFLSGAWFLRIGRSASLALAGSAAALFSVPLLSLSKWAISEPLFAALSLACLMALDFYLERGSRRALMAAAVFAFLATMTRFVGVSLIGAGVVAIWCGGGSARDRRRDLAWFAIIVFAPLAAWLARNYLIAATLTGSRFPSTFPFVYNLAQSLDVISTWLMPAKVPFVVRGVVTLTGLIMAATLILKSASGEGEDRAANPAFTAGLPILFFAVFYCAVVIGSASLTALDRIEGRFLSPLYVPGLALAMMMFRALIESMDSRRGRLRLTAALAALLCLWVLYPARKSLVGVRASIRQGTSLFASFQLRQSPFIAYLGEHHQDQVIYSNNPFLLYYLTGLPARLSAYGNPHNMPVPARDGTRRIAEAHPGSWLAWFKDSWSPFIPPEELGKEVELVPLASFEDGTIFRIEGKGTDASP